MTVGVPGVSAWCEPVLLKDSQLDAVTAGWGNWASSPLFNQHAVSQRTQSIAVSNAIAIAVTICPFCTQATTIANSQASAGANGGGGAIAITNSFAQGFTSFTPKFGRSFGGAGHGRP
ncbi:MAG: hypothetical protein ACFB3T_05855 [Geminicoccaceae bacterium]